MGKVPIVGGGEIDPKEMGVTLFHEHLRITTEVVRWNWPHLFNEDDEFQRAVNAVNAAKKYGVKTIVDLTVAGIGRDVKFDERIAKATGVNIIMGTGFYTYTELPFYFTIIRGIDALVDVFIHDIKVGIQGTSTKAAFVKAVIDTPGLTKDVEMEIRAAAKAHKETGVPIITHSFVGNKSSLELVRIFKEEGVDFSKVVIGHVGDSKDISFIEEILKAGAFVGLDRFGLDIYLPLEDRIRTTIELIKRGWTEQILLSHDYCPTIDWYPHEVVEKTVPQWSMTLIFEKVIPRLKSEGITQEQIDKILIDNPQRLFGK